MVLYSCLDFTYVSMLFVCVCMCIKYLQQQAGERKVLPGRGTVTFIHLKVTEISMFFIRLSIKLHGGEIWCLFQKFVFFSSMNTEIFLISLPERLITTNEDALSAYALPMNYVLN